MVQRLRGGGRCGCEMANEGFNRMERHAPILCNYPACLAVSRVGAAPVAEGSGRLSICMPQHCLLLLASIAVSLGQQSAAPPTTPSPPPPPAPTPICRVPPSLDQRALLAVNEDYRAPQALNENGQHIRKFVPQRSFRTWVVLQQGHSWLRLGRALVLT